jgi:hypothetical protein
LARWRSLAVLAAASAVLFVLFRDDGETLFAIAAVLALSVGLARVYDPAFAIRSLRLHNAMLLLIACLIAYPLLGVVDGVLAPVPVNADPAAYRAERLSHWLLTLWCVLPSVPLLATALSPAHPPTERPPLWPLGLGFLASLGLLAAGAVLWAAIIEPSMLGSGSASLALAMPPLLAVVALSGGIAGMLWYRAIIHRGAARLPREGIYRSTITAVTTALGLGLLGAVARLLADREALSRDPGVILALLLSLILCAAWMRALWRNREEPASALAAVLTVAALLPPLGASFVPPQSLVGIEGWVVLFGPVMVLVTLAIAAMILKLWPRVERRLLAIRF